MAGLRAVKPGEAPPSAVPKKTITQAAESGTYLELLHALRDRLAVAIQNPDCPARDLAALTKRLQDVTGEIRSEVTRAKEEERESAGVPDEAFDAAAL